MSTFLLGVPGKLKTLLDRLTAARANKLDFLTKSLDELAAADTALLRTTWTDTRAGRIDTNVASRAAPADVNAARDAILAALGDGSVKVIKSIQQVLMGSGDATINAVDTAKAMIVCPAAAGFTSSSSVNIDSGNYYLSNSTTVSIRTYMSTTGSPPSVYIFVVEFY